MRRSGVSLWIIAGFLLLSWIGGSEDNVSTIEKYSAKDSAPNSIPTSVPTPNVSLSPSSVSPQEVAFVDATRLNVRAGPGTEHKRVWTLKNNERVLVVSRQGVWANVKGDRYSGWVHGDYLTNRPAPATPVKLAPEPSNPTIDAWEVRQILIRRSIALYRGRCPCPYNTMKNGRACGGNSAYSRPGGASPLCYPTDVSDSMVRDYLARQ